jgi:hypothetical protein
MSVRWPQREDYDAFHAPRLETQPPPERPLEERAIEQRREHGLPIDPETIRRAVDYSQQPDYMLPGLFVTPEEEAQENSFDNELASHVEATLMDAGPKVGHVELCWLEGARRGVRITVKSDVERWQQVLDKELGSDRIVVGKAKYSQREQYALQNRIGDDYEELAKLGIEWSSIGPGDDGVEVCYFSRDPERADRLLRERYGPAVIPRCIGPSAMAVRPQPFGSWIAQKNKLTVFYPLSHNGEQPGSCKAEEHSDRVIVSLAILVPRGVVTAVGGFKPSYATVELKTEVGDRQVIDAAHNLPRPEWKGPQPGGRRTPHL